MQLRVKMVQWRNKKERDQVLKIRRLSLEQSHRYQRKGSHKAFSSPMDEIFPVFLVFRGKAVVATFRLMQIKNNKELKSLYQIKKIPFKVKFPCLCLTSAAVKQRSKGQGIFNLIRQGVFRRFCQDFPTYTAMVSSDHPSVKRLSEKGAKWVSLKKKMNLWGCTSKVSGSIFFIEMTKEKADVVWLDRKSKLLSGICKPVDLSAATYFSLREEKAKSSKRQPPEYR